MEFQKILGQNRICLSHASAMKQITRYHARDFGFDFRSNHTRGNPGSFQVNILKQPQTTIINAHKALYIRDIHATYKYHNDHKVAAQPVHIPLTT